MDPKLIPMFDDIILRNVTGVGVEGSIQKAGEFGGLGSTEATGEVMGVRIEDVDLSTSRTGWQCSNVTGSSNSNVKPAICAQLQ